MGAAFSTMPSVSEPETLTIKPSGLTSDQFTYILATYGTSSRKNPLDRKDWFVDTLSKHTQKKIHRDFYRKYLTVCGGKVGEALTKKFKIKSMETCLASDYSAAAYKLVMVNKKEIKKLIELDSDTASIVKKINTHLQKYNGYGGRETSCYK